MRTTRSFFTPPAAFVGLVILAIFGSGCTHPWMTVYYGMRDERIDTELAMEDVDMNARAPERFAPSPSNQWVVFLYDPGDDPATHEAFQSLGEDCFFTTLERENRTRHAAVCPLERVPPIPDEE